MRDFYDSRPNSRALSFVYLPLLLYIYVWLCWREINRSSENWWPKKKNDNDYSSHNQLKNCHRLFMSSKFVRFIEWGRKNGKSIFDGPTNDFNNNYNNSNNSNSNSIDNHIIHKKYQLKDKRFPLYCFERCATIMPTVCVCLSVCL